MADVTSAGTGAGGLGTHAARWSFVFLWACGILMGFVDQTFMTAPLRWATALLAALAGALLLTTPGGRPLARSRSAWLPAIAMYVSVVALSSAPGVGDLWALDFAAYLVAFLIARGNPIAGGLGSTLIIGCALLWALRQQASGEELALLLTIPIGCVAAGIVWRLVLGRIVGQERAHRSAAARAAERSEAAAEAIAASRAELADIRDTVAPLLSRIIAGESIDDAFRTQLVHAEAAVRDRICAPHLQHPVLVATISRLRKQGVSVVVLGEVSLPGQTIGTGLAEGICTLIAPVTPGRVTIRTLPPGRAAAVSVAIQGVAGSEQVLFSASGEQIGRI